MKILKFLSFIGIFVILFSTNVKSQEEVVEESPLSLSTSFVSTYVWRGTTACSSPSIQPSFTYSIGNFYVGTWGATDFIGTYKELDWFAGYYFKGLSATVYDYFWSFGEEYFDYNPETTQHYFELEFVFEPEAIPLRLQAATMLWGADKKYFYDDQETDVEKSNFSTYIELGYNFDIKGNTLFPFVGLTPFTGLYGEDFSVINTGLTASRDFVINDKLTLPISVSAIMNPQTEDYFYVFSLSF